MDSFDFRKEFSGIMSRSGFKTEMDPRKGVFKDPNVEYAFAVANQAR